MLINSVSVYSLIEQFDFLVPEKWKSLNWEINQYKLYWLFDRWRFESWIILQSVSVATSNYGPKLTRNYVGLFRCSQQIIVTPSIVVNPRWGGINLQRILHQFMLCNHNIFSSFIWYYDWLFTNQTEYKNKLNLH